VYTLSYLSTPRKRREEPKKTRICQSTYFEEWGHMGQNDSIVSLEEGLKSNKIKDGDVVVLAAAGIGWSWNAMTIKWGEWK